MKITQEVREFARLQEETASPSPLAGEGGAASAAEGEGASRNTDADAGMAEMSKRFHDEGGELYVPSTE